VVQARQLQAAAEAVRAADDALPLERGDAQRQGQDDDQAAHARARCQEDGPRLVHVSASRWIRPYISPSKRHVRQRRGGGPVGTIGCKEPNPAMQAGRQPGSTTMSDDKKKGVKKPPPSDPKPPAT